MTENVAFIQYLENLAAREDRGALAALRRGLGQPPGTVAAMYPYVVPWLPSEARPWQESTYYLVASLFALYPESGDARNLGESFRRVNAGSTSGGDERVSPVERRFTALLAAHPEDLPDHLRQAVSFLRSREVSINWHQLFLDVSQWGNPSRRVQRKWARAFWGHAQPESETPEVPNGSKDISILVDDKEK